MGCLPSLPHLSTVAEVRYRICQATHKVRYNVVFRCGRIYAQTQRCSPHLARCKCSNAAPTPMFNPTQANPQALATRMRSPSHEFNLGRTSR